ncbi:conjugal transfer protein TrbO [Xanthomonas hortorum]|uniref:conjugal transfer protein TrbO n=1 Tax=Xanthomonas hortorum TaxID=56454 RepID=UPI0020CCA9F7|nr:conjugal transfer protein TrbO [Xanthomonas hortorum]UTS74888.1 conjugal transfer protein TrbO [Xanthomonas hortorum]
MGIQNVMKRYWNGAKAYALWAADQAKAPLDLLVLGFGPVIVITLLRFLPTWASYVGGAALLVAALPFAFHVLMQYAHRCGRQ